MINQRITRNRQIYDNTSNIQRSNFFKRFWYVWVILAVGILGVALYFLLSQGNGGINISAQQEANSETIVVYGDTRDGNDIHKQIIDRIVSFKPIAVFHTGDLVNDGTKQEQWDKFNEITAPIRNILYPALGNHERNAQEYYNNFNLPGNERWYSVQSNYIYFVILDSTASLSADSEQMKWLKNELSKAKQSGKFIALVFHYSPYSSSEHSQDEGVVKLQTDLVPVLEANDIDLTFNGHDHVYERSYKDGIYYLTVGSSGAPLYEKESSNSYGQMFIVDYSFAVIHATKNNMQVNIYNASGKELDNIDVKKSE